MENITFNIHHQTTCTWHRQRLIMLPLPYLFRSMHYGTKRNYKVRNYCKWTRYTYYITLYFLRHFDEQYRILGRPQYIQCALTMEQWGVGVAVPTAIQLSERASKDGLWLGFWLCLCWKQCSHIQSRRNYATVKAMSVIWDGLR